MVSIEVLVSSAVVQFYKTSSIKVKKEKEILTENCDFLFLKYWNEMMKTIYAMN